VAGTELTADDLEVLRHPLVGGVILFTRNYRDPGQLSALVSAIHAARQPPLIVAVDQEGGRVQRFRSGFSVLPPARRHAKANAVSQLAMSYMHGMREAGMAATAKHFPGHGAVRADSHTAAPVDRRELLDMGDDLTPYRRLIANGLPAVMIAHVLFPSVDQDAVASVSSRWIRDVLRGDMGFQGVVFSDDMSMAGAAVAGDIVMRSKRALAAGCDMVLICNSRPSVVTVLERLDIDPEPASHLRLVRMRGRDGMARDALLASAQWHECRAQLARCSAPPALKLEAGQA
jgi:beta-N-acetylhexosaminidase